MDWMNITWACWQNTVMIEELDDKDRTYILAGKKKWKYLEYSPTAYMFVVFLY